jgi:ATP-dependent DNA ligase
MKRHGKLYKRNSNGSTNVWENITDGNKYWSEEGIVGGVITTSKPTICIGKNKNRANETTPEEQALSESMARRTKKLESGYTPNIKDIDTAVKYFKPMLCEKLEDYKENIVFSKGVYVQPKLDGMRAITQKSGMTSRNGKEIVSAKHIYNALLSLMNKYPNVIFDGELYCNKYKNDFNSIISLVKKTKPNAQDLADSAASIQYWIYDLPSCKDIFSVRTAELKKMLKEIKDPCIVFVETHKVNNNEEMDSLYGAWIESGYEGQILRVDEMYKNKRSSGCLKRKEFVDAEYVVTGFEEGVGNRAGTMGNVHCVTKDGKPFKSNIKGNFAYVTELWKNRNSLIGKLVTVKYFQLTPDGIPRFPYVTSIRDYE